MPLVVLVFDGGPQRLGAGVVPADPGGTHGALQAVPGAGLGHVMTREFTLGATVGMHDGAAYRPTTRAYRGINGGLNELGAHVVGYGPAEYPTGVLVTDRAQVDIAFTSGQIGDVRCPRHVDPAPIKTPAHSIGRERCGRVNLRGGLERARTYALCTHLGHDLGDGIRRYRHSLGVQTVIRGDP